jgi:sarcosine oxidase gamma subunit
MVTRQAQADSRTVAVLTILRSMPENETETHGNGVAVTRVAPGRWSVAGSAPMNLARSVARLVRLSEQAAPVN